MAGFRVDLGGEECRLVFVDGGLVGNFSVCAVEAVRTSKIEVAPVGFRSVLGCFFRWSRRGHWLAGRSWLVSFPLPGLLGRRSEKVPGDDHLDSRLLEICLDSCLLAHR